MSLDTHIFPNTEMESQSNTAASQPAMNFLASAQAGEAEKVPLREIQVRFGIDSKGKWLDDGVGGLGCRRARRRSGEHAARGGMNPEAAGARGGMNPGGHELENSPC